MLPMIISPNMILSTRKLVSICVILSGYISSCSTQITAAPTVDNIAPSQSAAADASTPTPQGLESTPYQTSVNHSVQLLSSDSDRLGLCFSYPQGYTQLPYNDSVEIVATDLPGSDMRGLFWLEISDSYDRTAEVIADQDLTYAAGLDVGRWTIPLDGEQAVVLDGMPGQDLQRRVYVVRQQMLYVLAFMPTRSENEAAADQMEALFTAITRSWVWAPCR